MPPPTAFFEGHCGVDTVSPKPGSSASWLSDREELFYLPKPQFPNLSNGKDNGHLRKSQLFFHSFITED